MSPNPSPKIGLDCFACVKAQSQIELLILAELCKFTWEYVCGLEISDNLFVKSLLKIVKQKNNENINKQIFIL